MDFVYSQSSALKAQHLSKNKKVNNFVGFLDFSYISNWSYVEVAEKYDTHDTILIDSHN